MTKAAELAKMGEVLTNSQIGGRRNMIINGAMQVAQRGTSQASITSTGYYTIDRWQVAITNGGTWTMSQDTDVPTGEGFANSLKMDCTTADTSFGASDSLYVRTKLESQDCQNMKKGTSSAEKVTLRFWVKSSKTGTHIVELLDNDNSRFVSLAYTISSADTWENHTLTFPADTTGAFADDNGVGLGIHWYMDWYLTGVQLEIGEQATPFEHRSFGEELRLCQRYFTTSYPDGTAIGNAYGSAAGLVYYRASDNNFGMSSTSQFFPVTMRASPTITIYSTKTGTSGSVTTEFTGTEYGSAVGGNITNKYFTPSDGSTAVSSNVRVSYEYTADGEL